VKIHSFDKGGTKMKRLLSLVLVFVFVFSLCGQAFASSEVSEEAVSEFRSLSDPDFIQYLEDSVYLDLIDDLNQDGYAIEKVEARYVSSEYLEELEYNSLSNVFFGYSLAELDEAFQGTRYAFSLNDDGVTEVHVLQTLDEDDVVGTIVKNVAIGSGVIILCATVASATYASAPAVSLFFFVSASTALEGAVSGAMVSGILSTLIKGYQNGNWEEAVKTGAVSASEGFVWGAAIGAISGGLSTAVTYGRILAFLEGTAAEELSLNEIIQIQRETGMPLNVISEFHEFGEYEVFRDANLKAFMVNNKIALVRSDIDLSIVDELGQTNLQRMSDGLPALYRDGEKLLTYELHHIGQEANATLAILTQAEHDNAVLHGFKAISEIDRSAFAQIRHEFWESMANSIESGVLV
jgi:hypothetical protein